MNIVITVLRDIVIDDVRNPADVDSTSDHIGGYQQSQFAGPQVTNDAVAFALWQITVNGGNSI